METACGYLDDKIMWISTDEKRMIDYLLDLKKKHPDEIQILCLPENNDGCLYLKCPAVWLKIKPPIKRQFTDEQRKAASERMKALRQLQ